ncbi:MAG: toll/interleukin-1 receptor domain-containing protein, partial [Chitinophagaceae bacterium]
MLVFLSYPSEFKEVAEALDAELRRRKIDTFYDKKGIKLGDDWQGAIEINIEKAYVFVVLYSPEAANTSKFYLREIERIEAACEKGLQRVIPVIFNPTKIVDVPTFYQQHQLITSETEGRVKEKRDDYWIAQIAQELERLKAIRDKLKQRQIISRSAQALGAITIVLLSISLFNTKTVLTDTKTALTDTEEAFIKVEENLQFLQGKFDGEKLCHSLIGKFTLHQNYIFVETHEKDARSTATRATWNAQGCVPNKRNGDFVLKGEEDTDFDIEAIIDGKYERIATARYLYGSEVNIRKDGTLVGRSFDAVLDAKSLTPFYKDSRGNSFKESKSFIDNK